jgi:plasmid stabilization system protein ParE
VPRRLDFAPEAADDLERLRRWHAQPGAGQAAERRMRAILAAIWRLRRTPCLHPHSVRPGTRQMVIEDHVVVYELHPDTGRNATAGDVMVLRVFGPGQDQD